MPGRRHARSLRSHAGRLDLDTIQISPDGRILLLGGDEPRPGPSLGGRVRSTLADWAPDLFDRAHESILLDLADGRVLARLRSQSETLTQFSPDGRWVLGERDDGITIRATPAPTP